MKRTTTFADHDILVWIAVAVTALLMLLFFTGRVAGIEQPPATQLAFERDASQTLPQMGSQADRQHPSIDMVLMVWQALEHQRQGEWEEALDVWHTLHLDIDADHWRHIAMAQAHLALGQYDEAGGALMVAEETDPNNAVMHYFRGLLRMDQVPHARDWYDAPRPYRTNYVVYQPTDVVPNSRAMYRYIARLELSRAIKFAGEVELDQLLTPEHWDSTIALGPTVGDLLIATGADNFAARAHNILGGLLLEEGALDDAEHHIDHAATSGMFVSYNYLDLIDEYEDRGYYLDAARVCAKAVGHGLSEDAAHTRAAANTKRALGW